MQTDRNHSLISKYASRLARRLHCVFAAAWLLLWVVIGPASWAEAAAPGTQIVNRVQVISDNQSLVAFATATAIERTPSQLEFLVYAPGSSGATNQQIEITDYSNDATAGGTFLPQPPPQPVGAAAPLPTGAPLPLLVSGILHTGNPLFLRLTDLDQNLYPTLRETVVVRVQAPNGDTELVRLIETNPNSGVFTGYLNTLNASATPVSGDGQLEVVSNNQIEGYYTDRVDGSDSSASTALIDPLGRVFDSSSGALLDGAVITLLNADGSDATVYGDNGISSYPATITSGGVAIDGALNEYHFAPGGYRFPYINPGNYLLRVVPPAGYGAPSTVPYAQLQALPGAPYAIVDGSKGETFTIGAEPIVYIDIPLDPHDGLWLQKSASQELVSIGDFIQYQLRLENTSQTAIFGDIEIVDNLPRGFRYRKGSTRSNGQKLADPTLSADGRTLTFAVGNLGATNALDLSYIVEVAAGSRPGSAVNRAQARDDRGNSTNTATATVTVKEAFFSDRVFLLGRVIDGNCSDAETTQKGLPNARIYLEDGTFVDTDEHGKFHFEGVKPGVHVLQLDLSSLPPGYEAIPCEQSSQFAGRTFSQFVDLRGGTLWRSNFYVRPLPPPTGEVSLAMSGKLAGQTITYQLDLKTAEVAASNLALNVMLPAKARFRTESATLGSQPLPATEHSNGAISFKLGDQPAGWSGALHFQADLDPEQSAGELISKAVLLFDSPTAAGQKTPLAEVVHRVDEQTRTLREEVSLYPHFPTFVATLQDDDLLMLNQAVQRLAAGKIVRVTVVGHTDNQEIAPRSSNIFADNQALSIARAESVASYLAAQAGITAERMTIRGMGEVLPVGDNRTESGRALNRRVDLVLETEQIERTTQLETVRETSGTQAISTVGRSLAEISQSPTANTAQAVAQAEEAPTVGISMPTEGALLPNPLNQVIIRLDNRLTPKLLVDGKEVPVKQLGVKIKDGAHMIYSYIGVDFGKPGEHTLQTQGVDTLGNARFDQTISVTRTDRIAAIRLVSADGNLADGRTPVTLRLQLLDPAGHVIPAETQLEFRGGTLSPLVEKNAPTDTAGERSAKITAEGVVRFQPVNQAGPYQVTLGYNETQVSADIFVKPAMRDWILVGFAEGTVGYNNLSGNQVNLKEAGIDEHFYQDDQVKFFAKGAIKGEWLLTMAYDSKKPNRDGDSLHQAIDPDSYYPLYGDGTQQGYEAASARKLYVKIERDQFYALFGDMQTGLTQTELSQYSRSMNGFKSELQTEKFSYTLFAADTRQAFAKDEIRGDGTSGRYYLTQKNLVTNSETVTIETRDRFHSEKILDVQTLGRHSDYDIDYDNGSLFFKRPVTSKDANFNPIFIVVRYETLDSSEENLNYGGRVAAKLLEQKVEIGASYVHEARGSGDGDLYGTDLTVKLTPQTTLHAEAATTTSRHFDSKARGDAYLAEVKHDSERVAGRVYYREQQAGFGLGQQNDSEGGTRKYGVETTYNMTPKLSASGLAYHEDQLGTGGKRDVAEVQGRYNAERYSLSSGLREARDQMANGDKQNSLQWLAGGSWSTENRRLTLRSTYEQSLAGSDENSDYPTLLTLGADYNLSEKVSVFAEQEFSWGAREDSMGTRAGFRSTPWQGGTLNSSVERQFNENGQRVFALFGLGQSWQISERWSIDGSLDRSHTLKQPGNDSLNSNVPPAHGTADDFTAVSLGATYKRDKWTWWNRLEVRQADSEDKLGVSTSIVGEPRDGVAVSAKAMAFITDASAGVRSTDGNLRLGLAYRPATSRWIFLNRLDFYFDQEKGGTEKYDSWRIVNNFHANFRLSNRFQTSFYSGLKYVGDTYTGDRYDSFTSLVSFEARYNLNKRWDIGVHGGVLHSWNSDTFDYTAGASVGYSPLTNTWVSLGYNFVGFRDDDFATANYTAQGAYLRFRAKFDQQTVREAAEWINK